MSFKVIGQRFVRKDEVAKVTGTAQYTVDVQFLDILHCVTLKSPMHTPPSTPSIPLRRRGCRGSVRF